MSTVITTTLPPSLNTTTATTTAATTTYTSTNHPKRPLLPPPFSSNQKVAPTTTTTNAYDLLDTRCKTIKHVLEIHANFLRNTTLTTLLHDQHNDNNNNTIIIFKLLRSYATFGRINYSRLLFDHLRINSQPNIFFWTAMIRAYAINNQFQQASSLYHQMLSDGVQPNAFTFSIMLKSCSTSLQSSPMAFKLGQSLHTQVVKLRFDDDAFVRTTLLDVYARVGKIHLARQLFDKMTHDEKRRNVVCSTAMINCYAKVGEVDPARSLFEELGDGERDVVCWNAMIDGYTQHGRPRESLALFHRMLVLSRTGALPNQVTMVSVLSACAQLGALDSGRWLHSYMRSKGIQVNAHVGTALIDMYCKCGSLEDARQVFDEIPQKDLVAWNSMIVGYAMHGKSEEALQLFSTLCENHHHLHPSDITYIGVLNACNHGGLVVEGCRLFDSMKADYGIEPKIEHYGCMVDLLGRAGFVEEAYDLVVHGMRKTSPETEPDSVLWGALLGACKLHGKIELGEKIAEYIVDNGLANSGTYVLLSNIYASAGNWKAVTRVRRLMKDTGIEKEPGCSSIEIQGRMHEFIAGDSKHHKSREIYLMLDELKGVLKSVEGYVPQTEVVLRGDVEEEWEKEAALSIHSERLAIAFGLISTRPGTPLRIVKNLRVCSDCHTFTKMVSKVMKRKIVVRDRSRFHHFVDGSCSCGDYW